jgi:cytochrome c
MTKETANRLGLGGLLLVFLALAIALLFNTTNHTPVMAEQRVPEGDPLQAAGAIGKYGCGTCHTIPGIEDAHGKAGPELSHLAERSILAGRLPNNPDNLMLWIQHPQQVKPGSDMPEMGVSDKDARDIAAYLYSLP